MPAKKSSAGGTPEPAVPFEKGMDRLEQVADELEGGEITLEESLARYEEGMRLSRRLTQTLDAAEKRIEKLTAGEDGDTTSPLDLEPGESESAEGELPF